MKILGTGLNGLVGSRIVELLSDKYEFENVSRSTGVDIVDRDSIHSAIKNSDAGIILHLAAKTSVDGCEEDRDLGENGEAWKINVLGTKNVAEACQEFGKKLMYISTDFVFDGEKEGFYREEDEPNPINWYGMTKYEGERSVVQSKASYIIARIAYPYRAHFEKKDFVRAIKARLESHQEVNAVTDHIFCPTFIDNIAIAIDTLVKQDVQGLYHVVGSQRLSPYEAANVIAETFDLDKSLISKTTREEYFKNKAARPFNLGLENAKIKRLGVSLKTFQEGLNEIKNNTV